MNGNLNNNLNILELPSDLYSRNLIISEGIKKYKNEKGLKQIRILDIGGRKGMLDLFLDKEDELTLLDIREGEEKNLRVGDATNMYFYEDNSFEVITSGDVFEHIPEGQREKFVKESLRVTNGLVILAAPFSVNQNEHLEEIANSYFKYLTGEDHEWLIEHINNGLPEVEDLETIISRLKVYFTVCESNNVDNWMLLQLLTFYLFKFKINSKKMGQFYRFYNEHIGEVEDENANFYRKIYFITKNGKFDYKFTYKYKGLMKEKLLEKSFTILADSSREFREEFAAMHGHAKSQGEIINHLDRELKDARSTLQQHRETIIQKEALIMAMKSSIFWKMRSVLVRGAKKFR